MYLTIIIFWNNLIEISNFGWCIFHLMSVGRSKNNNIHFSFFLLLCSLYHNMVKDKGTENVLISPVVVASSLGVVAMGGKASTASQVKTILRADNLKDEHLHAGLSELMSEV